jgi:hypothetical protein
MVKASSATRKTLKSWLKDQKAKAEKPLTPSNTDGAAEANGQSAADASQESKSNGEAIGTEKNEARAQSSLPAEEQPMPSIEVRSLQNHWCGCD